MADKIRAVLFDFGGTLIDYGKAGPGGQQGPILELARMSGIEPAPEHVFAAYRAGMRRVYAEYLTKPFFLHRDFFADVALGALAELGVEPGPEHAERYHELRTQPREESPFSGPSPLREGVFETLAALRERGLGLGIVSNTDDAGFRESIQRLGLDTALDWILTSEEAQSCKPDPGIFAEALRRSGTAPDETLFVGDSIDQDIAGANRAGLRSVLLWAREDRDPPSREPRPAHVIRAIPDLLTLV